MNELMWVQIETTKSNDDVWVFKGQVLRAIFEGIISNQLTHGYFRLTNVYWIVTDYDDCGEEKGRSLRQYGKGQYDAHHGDLYLKIEQLVTLAPIDGEAELAKFTTQAKKSLSVVTPIRE